MSEKNIILISQEYATHELTGKDEFTALEGRVGVAEGDINNTTQRVATVEGDLDTVKTRVSAVESTKQDKLTAGENITIENNVISASGGGSSKRYYYDVISTQPSSMTNLHPAPGIVMTNLEINYNYSFPEEGEIHITHVMIPSLTITRDNLYIGYAYNASAYKGPAPKKSFWLMTSQPLMLPEGETSKTYTDVECDFFGGKKIEEITCWNVRPDWGWTGWTDPNKPAYNKKIAYYSKSIVDGIEMFTWVADYESPAPICMVINGESYERWSNNPQFDKDASYPMTQIMVRASSFPDALLVFGIRYEFTPIGAEWPEKHTCTSFVPPNES